MLEQYKQLKGEKQFLKMLVADFISGFGSTIDNIAIPWLVYMITGDPVWVAIIFGSAYVPTIVLSPVLGVFIEKMSKKKVLLFSDICGVALMVLLAVLFLSDMLNPWILLAIVFVNSCIEAIRNPAGVAIIPEILSAENYNVGMSLSHTLGRVASLIGLGITGFLITVFGVQTAVLIDAATFLCSFLIIATIRYVQSPVENQVSSWNFAEFKASFKEGFDYLINNNIVKYICFFGIFINFFTVGFSTYLTVYVKDYMSMGPQFLSILSILFTLGSLLGSLLAPNFTAKYSLTKMLPTTGIVNGAAYVFFALLLLIPFVPLKLAAAFVVVFLYGLVGGVVGVSVSVGFMTYIEQSYLARLASVFNSLVSTAMPVSSALLALLAVFFGVDIIFLFYGILSLIITFAVMIFFKPDTPPSPDTEVQS
ncbi:MAG: MFS transporter [Spirochaetales bacterium]